MWTHQGLMHSWWKYEHASNITQTQEAYFVQDYNSLTGQKLEFLLLHVQKWQEQTGISFIFILSTEISHLCAMHTRIWALFSSLMKILWIHTCTFWTGLFIFTWVKYFLCFLNFYCHPKNNKSFEFNQVNYADSKGPSATGSDEQCHGDQRPWKVNGMQQSQVMMDRITSGKWNSEVDG